MQPTNHDNPNLMMFLALQAMQQQMQRAEDRAAAQSQAQAAQMEAMTERISGTPGGIHAGGGNKSRAKGRHPEKLERDVDYASFLQWEKTWNLYVISDNLETLTDQQKTAVFFSFFTKELLSNLEYRFKINIDADQRVEDIFDTMKTYLKGQRSMVLARYNLFTRKLQHGETFENFAIWPKPSRDPMAPP